MNIVTLPRFLWLGRLEGLSLLVLLFIAVPLKHLAGEPMLVRWVGSIHGALFLAYVYAAICIEDEMKWDRKTLFLCWFMSAVPFGTFWFERYGIAVTTRKNEPSKKAI